MTNKELEQLHPLDLTVLVLQEKLDKLYRPTTPLAHKLMDAIQAVKRAKENEEYLKRQMGG